jgi:hypothetical protein
MYLPPSLSSKSIYYGLFNFLNLPYTLNPKPLDSEICLKSHFKRNFMIRSKQTTSYMSVQEESLRSGVVDYVIFLKSLYEIIFLV